MHTYIPEHKHVETFDKTTTWASNAFLSGFLNKARDPVCCLAIVVAVCYPLVSVAHC